MKVKIDFLSPAVNAVSSSNLNGSIEILSPAVSINKSFVLNAEIKSATQAYCELVADAAASMPEVIAASKNIEALLITDTASGAIASFTDGADGMPVKSCVVQIEPIQEGSGDPSPTNIRPISGRTGAVVTKCGGDAMANATLSQGTIKGTDGTDNAANNRCRTSSFNVSGTVYVVCPSGFEFTTRVYETNGTYLANESDTAAWIGTNKAYTITGNRLMRLVVRKTNDANITPSAVPTFYVYENYTTLSLSFGQTVYGGTVDVTTGVLTVDMARIDLGGMNWYYQASYGGYPAFRTTDLLSVAKLPSANTAAVLSEVHLVSDTYKLTYADYMYGRDVNGYIALNNAGQMHIKNTAYSDADIFATAMSGHYIVYELATPQTYQLTPTQVASILGQNNIWSDTGDVAVEYRADIKRYINKVVAAAL